MTWSDPSSFWKKLPVVFDGGISSELYSRGCPLEAPPELWAASHPETLIRLHTDYAAAGATVATAATFGLYRELYTGRIDEAHATAIAASAVSAARTGAGERSMVAGTIGPTARPPHEIDGSQLRSALPPIVTSMANAGADFILLETQTSLREAVALTEAVRQTSDLPIVISFGFAWRGRTLDDFTPGQAVEEVLRFRPVAVGCNCAPDSVGMVRILQQMAPVADDIPVLIRPNAGIPRTVNGTLQYSLAPARLADLAGTYLLDGARLIGGCCGTSPAHTAAVAERLTYRELPSESDEY